MGRLSDTFSVLQLVELFEQERFGLIVGKLSYSRRRIRDRGRACLGKGWFMRLKGQDLLQQVVRERIDRWVVEQQRHRQRLAYRPPQGVPELNRHQRVE